jgi:hypothetical protein
MLHKHEVLIKIATLKSKYFGFWKSFVFPVISGGLLVIIVDGINALLDYFNHKWFTVPRLNRRVIEEDYSHQRILSQTKIANEKLNQLIEDIVQKIDNSNGVKRKLMLNAREFKEKQSKLEGGNPTYHRFVNDLNSILNSDLDLLEFIYQDFGKNHNNYNLSTDNLRDYSGRFDSVEDGRDHYEIEFRNIQF